MNDAVFMRSFERFRDLSRDRERLGDRDRSTLIATSRLSLVSRARNTSPMPPAPMGATISYEPRRSPGDRAISNDPGIDEANAAVLEIRGVASGDGRPNREADGRDLRVEV